VGNHRRALNRDAVGAPVIAIGVPTVIYASTIVRDALEKLGGEPGSWTTLTDDMLKNATGDMNCNPPRSGRPGWDVAGSWRWAEQGAAPGLSEAEIATMMP
jgi:S1-C subfamily serine protease